MPYSLDPVSSSNFLARNSINAHEVQHRCAAGKQKTFEVQLSAWPRGELLHQKDSNLKSSCLSLRLGFDDQIITFFSTDAIFL